jgi:hypothetical protein
MASPVERLVLLNRQGHAPKLRDAVDSSTTNGAVLKFDSSTESWYPGTDQQNDGGLPLQIAGGAIATSRDGVMVICSFNFDPSDYPGQTSFRFQAVLSCFRSTEQSSAAARARLYNSTTGNYVTSASLTGTTTTPTASSSASIPVQDSGDNIPEAGGVFELHLDVQNPSSGSTDTAVLGFAGMTE